MQRAMAAKDEVAAKRTPLLATFPKLAFPFLAIWPGLAVLAFVHLSAKGSIDTSYNMAIPYAMAHYYPSGLLGVGLVALIASFMSGQAGNVSAFNTIWTYDIYATYVKKDASDSHLMWMGRVATIAGTLIAVGTAYWVRSFSSILNYEQLILATINAPLFATVLLGMLWKRTTAWGAFVGLVSGTVVSLAIFFAQGTTAGSGLGDTYWRAWWAWLATAVITVGVSLVTKPKTDAELENLTWSLTRGGGPGTVERVWYKKPALLGTVALGIALALNIYFA
jgi:SSS family solute:Na+ symporter